MHCTSLPRLRGTMPVTILILGSFMCFSLMSCVVRMQVHTIALVALSFVRERSQAHQIDGMLNRVSEGRALD